MKQIRYRGSLQALLGKRCTFFVDLWRAKVCQLWVRGGLWDRLFRIVDQVGICRIKPRNLRRLIHAEWVLLVDFRWCFTLNFRCLIYWCIYQSLVVCHFIWFHFFQLWYLGCHFFDVGHIFVRPFDACQVAHFFGKITWLLNTLYCWLWNDNFRA